MKHRTFFGNTAPRDSTPHVKAGLVVTLAAFAAAALSLVGISSSALLMLPQPSPSLTQEIMEALIQPQVRVREHCGKRLWMPTARLAWIRSRSIFLTPIQTATLLQRFVPSHPPLFSLRSPLPLSSTAIPSGPARAIQHRVRARIPLQSATMQSC